MGGSYMDFFNHAIVKVDDLIPYALNSRTHSDDQVAQIAASIREFGFTNPVLVDDKMNLIAGHGRLLAARKLKLEEVPAITVTGLDDRKRRALVIADNKLALNADWDQVGRDLEGMAKDLSRWGKACADFDFAEKQIRKPPWYKALGGGVEAQAMEIFAQRKQLAAQHKEMKDWICAILGPSSWEELLAIEADIRKQKREHEWRRIELRQKIIEWVAGIFLFVICVGALVGLVLLMRSVS